MRFKYDFILLHTSIHTGTKEKKRKKMKRKPVIATKQVKKCANKGEKENQIETEAEVGISTFLMVGVHFLYNQIQL